MKYEWSTRSTMKYEWSTMQYEWSTMKYEWSTMKYEWSTMKYALLKSRFTPIVRTTFEYELVSYAI